MHLIFFSKYYLTKRSDKDCELTAGRAKKDMAKTEKQEATILPIQVWGTVSPYPIVVTVIWNSENKPINKSNKKSHDCHSSNQIVVTVI